METSELLKKVRKIEIKTRGLTRHVFAGQYHSAFKGKGMAFSEVREYQYGDDIRSIDWNVTARFNHPFIKIFEEERELTVMILVDVSGSQEFGSGFQLKKEMITEIASVLSFSAIQNNDKVGLILFSDKIEKFISPKKGKFHILRIIRELIDFKPENTSTDISGALRYLTNAIKRRSIAFVISDFIDFNTKTGRPNFEDAMKIANSRHDVVAIKVFDKRESEMPSVGFVQFKDAETHKIKWVDTSNRRIRQMYSEKWNKNHQIVADTLLRSGVDNVTIQTGDDYVKPLIRLFKMRSA